MSLQALRNLGDLVGGLVVALLSLIGANPGSGDLTTSAARDSANAPTGISSIKGAGFAAALPAQLAGSIQIGDDQARSRIVAGTRGSGSSPKRMASYVDQRQVGFWMALT